MQRLIPEEQSQPGERIVLAGERHSDSERRAVFAVSGREEAEIFEVVRRLRRGNAVRELVEPLALGKRIRVDRIEPLLASLANPSGSRWQEKIAAAWALSRASMTVEEREEAARLLYRQLTVGSRPDTAGRMGRWITRSIITGAGLTLLMACIIALTTGNVLFLPPMMIFGTIAVSMFASVPLLPISILIEDTRLNKVRAAAALALGRLRDVHSVGTLAGAVFQRDTAGSAAVRHAASVALPEAISGLTPDHLYKLDSQTVPNLCRALGHSNERVVLSVIEALEKIGDGRALGPVERIAKRGWTQRIRDAAGAVVPILQERHRQETDPGRLLRAAAAPHAPSTLLRPAGSPSASAETLLRPGE